MQDTKRTRLTGAEAMKALKEQSDKRGLILSPQATFTLQFENDVLPFFCNEKRINGQDVKVYEVDLNVVGTNTIVQCPLRMFSNGTYSDWMKGSSEIKTITGAVESDDLVAIAEFLKTCKDKVFKVNHIDFTKRTTSGAMIPSFRQKLILA
jgi:hypothetical protein